MPHKIKGTIGEAGRVLIFDESDFSTVEVNEVVGQSGAFDIEVPSSGVKMVLARSASGETIGYGKVNSKFELPSEFTSEFGYSSYIVNTSGHQYTSTWAGSTYTVYIGYSSGRIYQGLWHLPNVTIPKDSTILSATFRSRINNQPAGNVVTTMRMADQDNATLPTSSPSFANIPKTAGIKFSFSTAAAGNIHYFPDVSSQVQLVVNRAGWVSGNSMSIIFSCGADAGKLSGFTSYRSAAEYGYPWPRLSITWQPPS